MAREVFHGLGELDRLLQVFESSQIQSRYFCTPPSWFRKIHSPESVNELYVRSAIDLSASAIEAALSDSGVEPAQVDYLVFVSTTGLATPSIDARLMNVLPFRTDIRHTPVWGRGCAGGTFGLSHVCDFLRAEPKGIGVLVAAEFCGLTFVPQDRSRSNLIACALFGDGVGAAVLAGADSEFSGFPIVHTHSRFFHDSLDVMGWNIGTHGLQVVFNRRIPDMVRSHAGELLNDLLNGAGVDRSEIKAFLIHPGGRKVLEAYREALSLHLEDLSYSRKILSEYGNMSSATVLFVIQRFLDKFSGAGSEPGYAVASALGPGFCSESLLLQLQKT